MSKIVARPLSEDEPDLLIGHECSDLVFTDADEKTFRSVQSPVRGWTHDLLETQEHQLPDDISKNVWDAHLVNGDQRVWIGSSEI